MKFAHHLEIDLLGLPQVRLDGQSLDIARMQKPLTLLFYLAVESKRKHTREALAGLFWMETSTSVALRNLRQLLYRLRQALEPNDTAPPLIWSDGQRIRLNPELDLHLDVAAFEVLYADVQAHAHRRPAACPVCVGELEKALALYRGPLLMGWDVGSSSTLETWALLKQESLQRQAHLALHTVGEHHLNHGRPEEAAANARRLLSFDPWDEAAERLLLQALVAAGKRNAALAEYRRFRQALREELDIPPEEATQTLMDRIRAGGGGSSPPSTASLPALPGPFIGREAELEQLNCYLADRDHRLITIVGSGGSGKTWLAIQMAACQAPDWRHGLAFVSLAEVQAEGESDAAVTEALAEAVVAALDLPDGGAPNHAARLTDYLRNRELLLILDNLEHLLPQSASLLRRILRQAPQVKLLVTSQARLGVPDEWVVPLEGLSFPSSHDGADVLERDGAEQDASRSDAATSAMDYESVRLFAYHAQRVNPRWRLGPDNQEDVAQICRAVEGLPLGVELAAGWVRTLPCHRIAQEMTQNLGFLQRTYARGPRRQQDLRGACAYAYGLLSAEAQLVFRSLSVFHGSFDTAAAQEVAGATLSGLAKLLDRSLLRLSMEGRWDLHPLLRRYAAERLAEVPGEATAIRERFGRHYLGWLAAQGAALWGAHPQDAAAQVTVEWDNVQEAWSWAASTAAVALLERSIGPLVRYLELKGMFQRGTELFSSALARLDSVGDGEAPPGLVARLVAARAHFLIYQAAYQRAITDARRAVALAEESPSGVDHAAVAAGSLAWGLALRHQADYDGARPRLECAVAWSRSSGQARLEAEALRALGTLLWRQSEFHEARARFQAALSLDRRLGDRRGEGWTLNGLALVLENTGQYDRALSSYREALAILEAVGDRWGESILLGNLGYFYGRVGYYDKAYRCYQQDLRTCRELGDRRGVSWTLGYLSLLEHQRGREGTAERYARRGLTLARELDHDHLVARALTHLGHALAGAELWAAAEDAYQEALAIRRTSGEEVLALETLAGLIRVDLGRGDHKQALERAETLMAYLSQQDAARTDEQLRIYLACYRALDANDDRRAPETLEKAQVLLQERASQIDNLTMRRAFLNDVATHREILRLAAR